MTNISNLRDEATFVNVQLNGKIIVGGATNLAFPNGSGDFALLRYNSNGSPDSSFDKRGIIITDFLGLRDQVYASLIQPDGKVVLAGIASAGNTLNDFALARYEKNALIYYNTIKGSVFIDNNSNGLRGVGDHFYNQAKIAATKAGIDTTTCSFKHRQVFFRY